MANEQVRSEETLPAPEAVEYDAPRVESVLTAEDLAREIQYAGITLVEV
jgi:hypothetical protein